MNIDIQFEESNQAIDVDFGEIQIIGGSVVDATIEPLTVTENGTYTAQGDVDGYSPVHVNVPIPDGYIQPQGTIEITENGEYGVTEYANAIVNVEEPKEEQEKTIDITENGTTEVTPDDGKVLSKVTVNVDVEKGITPSGTLEITENGEYDVTEYASANVNVESSGGWTIDQIVSGEEPKGTVVVGAITPRSGALQRCQGIETLILDGTIFNASYAQPFSYIQHASEITLKNTSGDMSGLAIGYASSCLKLKIIGTCATLAYNALNGFGANHTNGVPIIYVPWSEGEVANAPWGATKATIHYNTTYDENDNPIV